MPHYLYKPIPMEARSHAYSVEDAQALLGALRKGEAFLRKAEEGKRKNPWSHWQKAQSAIQARFDAAKREIQREEREQRDQNDPDKLFEFLSGPEDELPQIPDYKTIETELDALIEKNNAALKDSTGEETIARAYDEEMETILSYMRQLASQHRPSSEKTLRQNGWTIGEGQLLNVQRKEWRQRAEYNSSYHGDNVLHWTKIDALRKKVKKARAERKLTILNAQMKAEKEAVKPPSSEEILEENYRLDEAAEKTLRHVLVQCVRFFVQLHGIDEPYASEITPEDLTLNDYQMALAAAPKALQPVAFEILRALLRGELLATLLKHDVRELTPDDDSGDRQRKYYGILSPELRAALDGIGAWEEEGLTRMQWEFGTPHHYINGNPKIAQTQRRPFYRDMSLQPSAVEKFLWGKALFYKVEFKGEKIQHASDAKLLACTGNLAQWRFVGTNLLHFMGNANGSHFQKGTVKYSQGEWNACEFDGTEITGGNGFRLTNSYIHDGMVRCHEGVAFTNVIFHNSELVLEDIAPLGEALFEGCDFTGIKIPPKSLMILAARSKNCRFDRKKLKKIPDRDSHGASATEDHWEEIDTIIADRQGALRSSGEWQALRSMPLKDGLKADMLDSERRTLKGVPPSTQLSGSGKIEFDPREWAAPLGPNETVETFTTRRKTYEKLVKFVSSHPDMRKIRLSEWMELLHDMGSPAITDHLGLPGSLLHYSPAMLGGIATKKLWYGEKAGRNHLSYLKKPSDEPPRIARYLEEGGRHVIKKQREQGDWGEWGANVYRELTPYAKLQHLRKMLIEMFQRLHQFGQYMQDLLDKGYAFPTINPMMRGAVRFTGLVHPDVNAELEGQAVPNNITLEPDKDTVINISSADNNDGKSTLQAAIALAVLQVQCGLPVPARKTEFNPGHGFDHIMVLPNTRADAGQGQGVMRERGGRFKELRERLAAIADTENPPRVLILMDEISMGATSHDAAIKLDTRMVLELAMAERTPGIKPLIIAIVQDADKIVPEWRKHLSTEKVKLIARLPKNAPYTFVTTKQVVVSSPDVVLGELDLGHLLDDKQWAAPPHSAVTSTS